MPRISMALGVLCTLIAGPVPAQVVTGGAGDTGVAPPAGTGGVDPDARGLDSSPIGRGNAAAPGISAVPGTTPDVNIGGTPTGGPPGTGGTSGGPALSGR